LIIETLIPALFYGVRFAPKADIASRIGITQTADICRFAYMLANPNVAGIEVDQVALAAAC
jgi:hypothetical protein